MKKKVLIIIGLIIILAIAAALIWYFVSRKEKEKIEPVLKTEGKLLDTIMEYPSLSSDNKWIYYYSTEQTPAFYRTNIETKETLQISGELSDIQKIKYSSDREFVLFKVYYDKDRFEQYGSPFLEPEMDNNESRFWVYNFEKRTLSYLSEEVLDVVFSLDSKKLIYSFLNPDGKFSINQSDLDGTNYKKITDWPGDKPAILVQDSEFVIASSITEEKGENDKNGLYKVYIPTGRMDLLTNEDYNDIFSISPKKESVLFFDAIVERETVFNRISIFTISDKEKKDIYKSQDFKFNFENIAWSQNEKNVYVAAAEIDSESYDRIFEIHLDGSDPRLLLGNKESNFEVVGLDDPGEFIYYLMDSQLYRAKL